MIQRRAERDGRRSAGWRRNWALNPTTPLKAAGRITEPSVCVPSASGTRTGRDRGRGARRRTAGRMRRVPRIDGRSWMAPRKFGRDGLAEDRSTKVAQPVHHPGVRRGDMIAVDRRAVGGRHVRGGDDVLDGDGNARQRSRPPRHVYRKNLERLSDGSTPLSFQTCRGVSISRRAIAGEQAQQFEHSRARRTARSVISIRSQGSL